LPSSLNVKSVFTIKPWGKSDLKILLLLAQITSSTTSQIAPRGTVRHTHAASRPMADDSTSM